MDSHVDRRAAVMAVEQTATMDQPTSFDLAAAVRGCTFDDFLFAPQFSVVERRDPAKIDLSCQLSQHLTLSGPSCRPTWIPLPAPRWRSSRPKKAGSA